MPTIFLKPAEDDLNSVHQESDISHLSRTGSVKDSGNSTVSDINIFIPSNLADIPQTGLDIPETDLNLARRNMINIPKSTNTSNTATNLSYPED